MSTHDSPLMVLLMMELLTPARREISLTPNLSVRVLSRTASSLAISATGSEQGSLGQSLLKLRGVGLTGRDTTQA